MSDRNLEMAKKIAEKVAEAGGRTYFVGGFVRDRLLGRDNKDIDIEIHGITPAALEEILDSLGERTVMGASFGIFGLRHYDLDIAMPRSEKNTGRGHKDFEVFVNPFIGVEKAAMRRDFTINALMEDVLTGEILDFFGGKEDLREGKIRHVNAASFVEDPLRVLRGAGFAARFHFTVAEETVKLCRTMDLRDLAGERILGELKKAFLKSDRPSVFFEELRRMNQLSVWFPELILLIDLPQDPIHHPEGSVWIHTMQVVDVAAGLRKDTAHPFGFMLAALCHDLGKAVTTEERNGRIHAYEHESRGIPIAKTFLKRITNETDLRRYVENMVELHMMPNAFVRAGSSVKSYMKLFDRSLDPDDLILLAKADHLGRTKNVGDDRKLMEEYEETSQKLKTMRSIYTERMERPCVRGKDLIDLGFKPGPLFTETLAYAHKLRLAGIEKDSALKQVVAYMKKLEKNQKVTAFNKLVNSK